MDNVIVDNVIMDNLILTEYDAQGVRPGTLSTIAAAAQAGGAIDLVVMGAECAAVAAQAAGIAGVRKVLLAEGAHLHGQLAEDLGAVLVALAPSYRRLWAPAGTFGKNVMPRAAALLDIQQISDISKVIDAQTFERPIYAGNALAVVRSEQERDIITVRTTAFEAVADTGGSAPVERVDVPGQTNLARYVRSDTTPSERPELTSARVVVSGGRGMQAGENFAMLDAVAQKLGAAVGASRAAVDSGFVPNDYQVGQTGKVVSPDLYIAVGISGAIQHLAGMKDSKVIVAINKDDEAPIFQVADYGLVADLFTALPELDAELARVMQE